jgi:hypothetical protein
MTSWVEVCRQRAVVEQAEAAVLSAEARHLALIFSPTTFDVDDGLEEFVAGLDQGERLVLGTVQRHAANAYLVARIWADTYRTALIESASQPWMAAA